MDRMSDLLHTDLAGPLPTQSVSGFSYFITYTDDHSRFVWGYPLKNKSVSFPHFVTKVFRIKYNTDGNVCRRMARLCAQDVCQQPEMDYTSTYAPTGRLNALQDFLFLSTSADLEIRQIDVINAFLIPDLDTTMYMEQHQAFAILKSLITTASSRKI